MCHYGALVTEIWDAWVEGDGNRVILCWKLFMPHFRSSGCTKYALEATRLQIQLQTLSPNFVHQITRHLIVNTRGGHGNNIPCDLYNEHVNKTSQSYYTEHGSKSYWAVTEKGCSVCLTIACHSRFHDHQYQVLSQTMLLMKMIHQTETSWSCTSNLISWRDASHEYRKQWLPGPFLSPCEKGLGKRLRYL